MGKFTQRFVNFVKCHDGSTAIEYAIIVSVIVVVCVSAIRMLGSNALARSSRAGNAVSVAS